MGHLAKMGYMRLERAIGAFYAVPVPGQIGLKMARFGGEVGTSTAQIWSPV